MEKEREREREKKKINNASSKLRNIESCCKISCNRRSQTQRKKKSKQRPQMQGKMIKIKWSHGYKSFNKRNRDGSSWNRGEEGS